MAQLRDAQTGELVAEGNPLELVLIAGELGTVTVVGVDEDLDGDVDLLFDDVGVHFDPEAVLEAARARADGLAAAARDPKVKGDERKELEEAAKAAKAELEVDRGRLEAAKAELERIHKG